MKLKWLIGIGLLVSLGFQNCSGFFSGKSGSDDQSTLDLPSGHPAEPDPIIAAVATGSIVLGDRDFLESVFRDVFDSSIGTADTRNYLNAVLNQEFGPTQQMLGRSCNPLEEGTTERCGGQLTNVNIAMQASTSAIREAARIQVCRRVLANDSLLNIAVLKVRGQQSTPNKASVVAAVGLFYPTLEDTQDLGQKLQEMDQVMAQNAETEKNRWRLIFLTLCEAPTWQIL